MCYRTSTARPSLPFAPHVSQHALLASPRAPTADHELLFYRSLPTPAATPSPTTALPRPSSTLAMSTESQLEPEQHPEIAAGSAPLQRRHSIHTTSPTSTDGLPLPEEATEPAPSDGANPEEQDRPAPAGAGQPSGLASFDSLYSAINYIPVQAQQHPYYPIGGPSATYSAAAPSQFASEWGPPPSQRHLGGGGQQLQNPPLYPVSGKGEKRTGRCKFFNALKVGPAPPFRLPLARRAFCYRERRARSRQMS